MQNKVQNGKTITYAPSGGNVSTGQFLLIGALAAVALTDIADGETGACQTEGVFELPKATGAINQGAQLYWDADGDPVGGVAGSGALTTTPTDNTPVGKAWADAASGDAKVKIKINC